MGTKIIIKIFLTALIFLFFANSSKAENTPLVTEVVINKNDSVYRYLYLYSIQNQITLETAYIMRNDAWVRVFQTEWFYDENGFCEEQSFRKWVGSNWIEYYRIERDNSVNSNIVSVEAKVENAELLRTTKSVIHKTDNRVLAESKYKWFDSNWVLIELVENTYIEDKISEVAIKNFVNSQVDSEKRIQYIYTADSLEEIIVQEKSGDEWENLTRVVYYDNFNDSQVMEVSYIWNSRYAFWENSQKIDYEYDLDKRLISERFSSWDSQSFWSNVIEYQYDYNQEGQLVTKRGYQPIHRDLRLANTVEYKDFIYNKASVIEARNEFWSSLETNSPLTTIIPYQFNNSLTTIDANRILISYIPVDTSVITQNKSSSSTTVKIYPNPSDGVFYFNLNELVDAESWKVYDLNGKVILSKHLDKRSGVIDLGDYQAGVYLLQIVTNEGIKSQKLIKK